MRVANAMASLDVKHSTPAYHCAQDSGRHTFRVSNINDDVTVYLNGTPVEIIAWAAKVRDAALNLVEVDRQWVDTSTDPPRVLSFDECAQLGLDGTGR